MCYFFYIILIIFNLFLSALVKYWECTVHVQSSLDIRERFLGQIYLCWYKVKKNLFIRETWLQEKILPFPWFLLYHDLSVLQYYFIKCTSCFPKFCIIYLKFALHFIFWCQCQCWCQFINLLLTVHCHIHGQDIIPVLKSYNSTCQIDCSQNYYWEEKKYWKGNCNNNIKDFFVFKEFCHFYEFILFI